MRILHVVPSYLPAARYGGPIVSVHGLCKALANRGHDVHVFTTNVDGETNSAVPLGVPVELDGVRVWYFPVPLLRRLYWAPQMNAALSLHVSGFHVVHTHSVFLWPTWAAARAAAAHKIPYIVAPRGMLVKELIQRRNRLAKNAWISLVERRNIEGAKGIHVTSDAEAKSLSEFQFATPPIYEVPNGVDADGAANGCAKLPLAIKEMLDGERPVVLYLGRIHWKKGLDRLIKAMRLVPNATVLMVGNDEENYKAKLSALAEAEGITDRIAFAEGVYGNAKYEIYRRAAIFVLPSLSENFGNVVLEAMVSGCPVIVTPEVGASAVVVQAGGGVVVEGEPVSLAKAIQTLLEDPKMRKEMGERGKEWVTAKYSWESIAGRMLDAYRQVSEGRQICG